MQLIHKLVAFFLDNFPSLNLISWLFPISILWSFLALFIAGYCKRNLSWKTGYTRKVFHFLIFISAFFYQKYLGIAGVFILGWSVTIALIYACLQGNKNLLYEAIAREKDAPHRTKYIVYSYLATFIGGVLSNLFFAKFAIIGYAVTGIADAIAEPIGTRFGKHQYRVFSFDRNKISYRSLEGSLAVFIATLVIFFLVSFFSTIYPINVLVLIFMALCCTLVEAFSPSGFDNMLLQLAASGFFFFYFK